MAEPDPPKESHAARAAAERAAEAAKRSQEARERLRRAQDRVRSVAAHVSEVETQAADTFRRVAATADEQGRAEDAARLREKAEVAERVAQQEEDRARHD